MYLGVSVQMRSEDSSNRSKTCFSRWSKTIACLQRKEKYLLDWSTRSYGLNGTRALNMAIPRLSEFAWASIIMRLRLRDSIQIRNLLLIVLKVKFQIKGWQWPVLHRWDISLSSHMVGGANSLFQPPFIRFFSAHAWGLLSHDGSPTHATISSGLKISIYEFR